MQLTHPKLNPKQSSGCWRSQGLGADHQPGGLGVGLDTMSRPTVGLHLELWLYWLFSRWDTVGSQCVSENGHALKVCLIMTEWASILIGHNNRLHLSDIIIHGETVICAEVMLSWHSLHNQIEDNPSKSYWGTLSCERSVAPTWQIKCIAQSTTWTRRTQRASLTIIKI